MPSLTIIGGTVLDCLSKVKDLSCPCTQVLDYSESIGGMAYNTSLCTTQLGVETRLISAVGADFPKLPLYKGLDLDFARLPAKSARCMLFFDEKSERIFFFRGCYHDIDTDRAKAAISRSDWVHFAGIAPCFAELAEFADKECKIISSNPGYDLFHYDPNDPIVKSLVKMSDYLILSDSEAKHLDKPVDSLINTAVIVTMGKSGSVIAEKDKKTQIDAFPVETQSPFGAGDAYTGAFIASMMSEKGLEESGKLASAAASFAVEEKSTTPDLDWEKVEKRAKKL
jgi:sugar/nucleoside kinase (ribokinase family)